MSEAGGKLGGWVGDWVVGDRLSASDTRRKGRERGVASGSKCGRV